MLLNASFHLERAQPPGFEAPDEVINAITRFPTEVSIRMPALWRDWQISGDAAPLRIRSSAR